MEGVSGYLIKFDRGLRMTTQQLSEFANCVLVTPDMGLGHDSMGKKISQKVYEVENEAEHGTYVYRVNRSWKLITLIAVRV